MEVHGTTKKKPYPTFLTEEQPHLMPLPSSPLRTSPLEGMHRPSRPSHRLRQILLLTAYPVYRQEGMGEGNVQDHGDLP